MTFHDPYWLVLLLVPLGVTWLASRRRAQGYPLPPRLWAGGLLSTRLRPLGLLGLILVIVALARPQGERVQTQAFDSGRDLIILLDVSRSMLAQDLKPNRLERTKEMLADLVAGLKGERVGLVLFSGGAQIASPLTRDYGFFLKVLAEANPEAVQAGGTAFAKAIELSLEQLFFDGTRVKDMLLISDGGDQLGGLLEVAQLAKQKGVRVHSMGVGTLEGALIPDGQGGTIQYQGNPVKAKLMEAPLRLIAEQTEAIYLSAQDKRVDLSEFFHEIVEKLPLQTQSKQKREVRSELYFWLLWPGVFFLTLEALATRAQKSLYFPLWGSQAKWKRIWRRT